MARTLNETIQTATQDALALVDPANPPRPLDLEADILFAQSQVISLENMARSKDERQPIPKRLAPFQIAQILMHLYRIVRVVTGGYGTDPEFDLLAIYDPERGVYVTDDIAFRRHIRDYDRQITRQGIEEVMLALKDYAPRVARTMDPDLIAVNNGVFDFRTKELLPFSPDYVFLTKSRVDYDPDAVNVTIHNDEDGLDWDVESWIESLSDDVEVVELIWQILGAIIRPFVRWNRSAWFYSNTGNNGKGTLCSLMRNLVGEGNFASIPLDAFSKDFALEPLIRTQAIIVDENDVGAFIDKAANLKAIITQDVVPINRKFKTPISFQFFGFMVQCLNDFPRIKDKSDSFYRRQLFIPFTKCFTGRERAYIKDDYLKRDEVLRYVLYRVLHMDFYQLSEPACCLQALNEYKDFNDPVRQFVDDVLGDLAWDMVPFSFLYDLYKAWFRKNIPNGSLQGRNTFVTDLLNILTPDTGWVCPGRTVSIRPGNRMDKPEPMIVQYALDDWKNPNYTGSNADLICRPAVKVNYTGIVRASVADGGWGGIVDDGPQEGGDPT